MLTFVEGGAAPMEPCRARCSGTRCFAAFHRAADSTAARDGCADLGGHLMTVRSSSIHDILPFLLGNLTGRFWIGLHLATGCPDPAAELRGFRWATGEVGSEFTHWPAAFDGSCSSPRCVSVSQEDDFEWVQGPCGDPLAGFLCEHGLGDPCEARTDARGAAPVYTPAAGLSGEVTRSSPPGSTAVRTPPDTKYFCVSGRWQPAPRSCGAHEGVCERRCAENPERAPSPDPPTGTDDPCVALDCAQGCHKDGRASACTCGHGFKLARDGRSCVHVDDCADERRCTGENSVCVSNSVGGSRCVCEDGYKSRSGRCVDVDECASAPCEHKCANTPGSYECGCFPGYKKDPKSPHTCALFCGEEECAAECDPNNRFQCFCPDGYVADERGGDTVCTDIDECSSDYCDDLCRNTFGSYVCACSPGYTLVDQFRCVKNEGPTDEEPEGSGEATSQSFPTTTTATARPEPPRRPSAVSAGGLAGIIVCTVFFCLLMLFVARRVLGGGGETRSAREMESGGAPRGAEDHALSAQRETRGASSSSCGRDNTTDQQTISETGLMLQETMPP